MDQFVAGLRDVGNPVTGVLQRIENLHGRGWCVQAHRVADAGILGWVIAEDDGNLLLCIGLQRQVGLLDSKPRHQFNPVFPWHVPL